MKYKFLTIISISLILASCKPVNTRSRTLASSSATDCAGGNPVLTQSCANNAPAIAPSDCYIAAATAGTSMTTTESKTLTAVCLNGDGLSYSWFKNNVPTGATTNSLLLSKLSAGSHSFHAIAKNSAGSATLIYPSITVTSSSPAVPFPIPMLGNELGIPYKASDKIYNYAPSSILENGNIYTWTCSNVPTPGDFDDVIGFFINGKYSGVAVNNSSDKISWDGVHVCDPSVIKGNFAYQGESYSYLMAFLGEDWNDANGDGKFSCDNILCEYSMHNQIGVAFSKSITGPWVKHPSPVVAFTDRFFWGAGQPSLIKDADGSIIMFYTRGDKYKTAQYFQKFDFTKSSPIALTPPVELHSRGIVSPAGVVMQRNSDFALRPEDDRLFMIRGGEIEPNSFVQVASITLKDLLEGKGTWTTIKTIDKKITGQENNHDSGLLRTPEGHVVESNRLTTFVTTNPINSTYDRHEWDYNIKSFVVDVAPPASEVAISFVPTITKPSNNASVNAKIEWNATTSPHHYWIDLSEHSDFRWFWNHYGEASDRSLNYTADGWGKVGATPYPAPASLAPSRTYYVRVSAFDSSGKMIPNGSAVKSFTTAP